MATPLVAVSPLISGPALSEDVGSLQPRLDGRQVVVTRAVPQAAPLIEALAACGAVPLSLPLLEIVDAVDDGAALQDALLLLGDSDWLVVLSPNGAKRVLRLDLPDVRPKLAVIASGTGTEFSAFGWPADLVPDVASSVGLLDAFAKVDIAGRVLIAQAEAGRTELATGLMSRGIEVDVVAAYRNVMPALDEPTVDAARRADVVVFASPSAVERYVTKVGKAPTAAVCIGAVTAETAVAAGFVVTTAQAPTVEAIVTAVRGCE